MTVYIYVKYIPYRMYEYKFKTEASINLYFVKKRSQQVVLDCLVRRILLIRAHF